MDILLVSHGEFAKGLLNTIKMIGGKADNIHLFGLEPQESVDSFQDKVFQYIQNHQKSIVIFADLLGGSPMLASIKAIEQSKREDIVIVSGVNVPILLEVKFMVENSEISIDQLIDFVINEAKEGIKVYHRKEVKECL